MLWDEIEQYTYDYLLQTALAQVPDTVDKSKYSIIFDALAPACYSLAEGYQQLKKIIVSTYALTASGEWLDYRAAEQGIHRRLASPAQKRGSFFDLQGNPRAVDIGTRFATITETTPVTYYVSDTYKIDGGVVFGQYILTCETAGIIGNSYIGNLLPITYVNGLGSAYMDTLIQPGADEETDDAFRQRYLDRLGAKAFAGNIAHYREMCMARTGVGAVQVYPVWDGGGTVKLSIVDSEFNPISNDFRQSIKNYFDPDEMPQQGYGQAPIGHLVTISTPEYRTINIEAKITPVSDYTAELLQASIELALEDYISSLKREWARTFDLNTYEVNIYLARVSATILSVGGVLNVTDVKVNGNAQDLVLTQTGQKQEMPTLGTVNIYE